MPKYLVLRLHPIDPVRGADFKDYLDDLKITVHDLALDNAGKVAPKLIGTATDADIVQHFKLVVVGLSTISVPTSVATTVIEIPNTNPDTRTEYETSDIRIEVKRDGKTIVKNDLNFNVRETANIAKPAPNNFQGLTPVSFYIALPAPRKIDLNTAILELPEDGRPPSFADLYQAVKTVLQKEPGVANTDAAIQARLRTLTPAEAHHIAYEIMHHPDVYPPAEPSMELETIFTLALPGRDETKANQARDLFKAETVSHKATRAAQAERVSTYVYSLAAAFVTQKMSQDALKVGFTFPIHPGGSDLTKVQKAKVVLKN